MTKTRDVKAVLQEKGIERGTQHLFEILFEAKAEQQRQLVELGNQMLHIAEIIENFVGVADNMKKVIDKFKEPEDKYEFGDNTNAIGRRDD